MIQQVFKAGLPKGFKDGNGHSVAQVEAPGLATHGDTNALIPVCFQKILRKALCFLAEEQVAVIGEFRFTVAPGCFGGKAPELPDIVFGEEIFQIVVDPDIHQMPVIQTGPADSFFGDIEAQRADQMEPGTGSGTGSGNIAAVLGNLRLMEYHVEQVSSPQSKPFGTLATLLYCKTVIKSTQKFGFFQLFQYYKK